MDQSPQFKRVVVKQVSLADAHPEEHAVVVEHLHTALAVAAVERAGRLINLAHIAPRTNYLVAAD